jgi:hypothetical protein
MDPLPTAVSRPEPISPPDLGPQLGPSGDERRQQDRLLTEINALKNDFQRVDRLLDTLVQRNDHQATLQERRLEALGQQLQQTLEAVPTLLQHGQEAEGPTGTLTPKPLTQRIATDNDQNSRSIIEGVGDLASGTAQVIGFSAAFFKSLTHTLHILSVYHELKLLGSDSLIAEGIFRVVKTSPVRSLIRPTQAQHKVWEARQTDPYIRAAATAAAAHSGPVVRSIITAAACLGLMAVIALWVLNLLAIAADYFSSLQIPAWTHYIPIGLATGATVTFGLARGAKGLHSYKRSKVLNGTCCFPGLKQRYDDAADRLEAISKDPSHSAAVRQMTAYLVHRAKQTAREVPENGSEDGETQDTNVEMAVLPVTPRTWDLESPEGLLHIPREIIIALGELSQEELESCATLQMPSELHELEFLSAPIRQRCAQLTLGQWQALMAIPHNVLQALGNFFKAEISLISVSLKGSCAVIVQQLRAQQVLDASQMTQNPYYCFLTGTCKFHREEINALASAESLEEASAYLIGLFRNKFRHL